LVATLRRRNERQGADGRNIEEEKRKVKMENEYRGRSLITKTVGIGCDKGV